MNRYDLKACDTMAEWVSHEDYPDTYYPHGAGLVADRMDTVDLFRAHAECIRHLSAPHLINTHDRWVEALDAVCETLGKRVDGAYSRGMR